MCLAKLSKPKIIFTSIHQCWDGGMRGAIEFAVPRQGCWRVRSEQNSLPYRESLPLLTSPPGSARTVVPKGGPEVGLFFFPPIFSVFEKTAKKRAVKKSTFSGNVGDFDVSGADFRPFGVRKRVSGGSSGRVFRTLFPDAVLHGLFVVFSVKNVKLEK